MGSLLGVAGGAAGAMSYHLYDGNEMGPFRHFCLGAAAVSCLGFWWTGTRLDVGRLDTFKRKYVRENTVYRYSVCIYSWEREWKGVGLPPSGEGFGELWSMVVDGRGSSRGDEHGFVMRLVGPLHLCANAHVRVGSWTPFAYAL